LNQTKIYLSIIEPLYVTSIYCPAPQPVFLLPSFPISNQSFHDLDHQNKVLEHQNLQLLQLLKPSPIQQFFAFIVSPTLNPNMNDLQTLRMQGALAPQNPELNFNVSRFQTPQNPLVNPAQWTITSSQLQRR
jgi:hypothetical protein